MVLDRETERMIAETHLLDDVVGRAPRFDFEAVAKFIEGLMMRAVDLIEAMSCGAIGAQRLDIAVLHFGRVMAGNVEMQGAAESDVEELPALANREDRQLPLERVFRCHKFPAVAIRLHVGIENRRIRDRL